MAPDDIEIKLVVDNWAQAIRDASMDGILARHTPGILMFDVPVPLQNVGLDAYNKVWELYFQSSAGGECSFELIDLKIFAGEAVAFFSSSAIGGLAPEYRLTLDCRRLTTSGI